MVKAQIPEGYATIRRSKSRGARKIRTTSMSSMENQQSFEMMEMNERNSNRNSINRSGTLYSNHQNDIYDDAGEVDEGVINDIDADVGNLYDVVKTSKKEYFCDNQRTLKTFKPQFNNNNATTNALNSPGIEEEINDDVEVQTNNNNNSEYYQSLPYDLLMPLKSPQYINQLNTMRCKPLDAAGKQQFPLYSRPDSPKYGKILYARSTSPSADSIDCSSNSSTYSSAYRQASSSLASQDDDNHLILVNQQQRKPPLRSNTLNYRKSFSCVTRTQNNGIGGRFNGSFIDRTNKHFGANSQEFINYEQHQTMATGATTMMTKSLAIPSVSTSNLYTNQRYATLAHPKEKSLMLQSSVSTKSTSSLNENHVYWDPVLSSKIGSQTTLRTKPDVPWWELACKKDHRQSCPPMQVNMNLFSFSSSFLDD